MWDIRPGNLQRPQRLLPLLPGLGFGASFKTLRIFQIALCKIKIAMPFRRTIQVCLILEGRKEIHKTTRSLLTRTRFSKRKQLAETI